MARPSPNPIACLDATKTFLASHWCCTPGRTPLEPAGAWTPASRATAGRPSPRTRLLRPSPDEPRPPKGSSRAPLHFPPLSPRRRRLSSPEIPAPPPLCSVISARDSKLKETKFLGVKLQNVHKPQNSKIQKCLEHRIKIRKMQTKMFWNPCNMIYKFCYMNIFIICLHFNLRKRIDYIGSKCSRSCAQ